MFHNLSGYDAYLFIKELAASSADGAKMGVIAKNKEGYISFSIKIEVDKYIHKNGIEKSKEIELRFIDSFKFMSSSLDSLVNNLTRGGSEFFGFEEYNENQYKLLIRKGIYPYKYMTDWDKFKETKLPPREAFYSKLNMAGVEEEDYEHTNRVWKEFGPKDLEEYHDLCLESDVILLANVFEAFRKVCLKPRGGTSILRGREGGGFAPEFASEILVEAPNFASRNVSDKYPKFCPLNFRYDPKIGTFSQLLRLVVIELPKFFLLFGEFGRTLPQILPPNLM